MVVDIKLNNAVMRQQYSEVKEALKSGSDPNSMIEKHWPAVVSAAGHGCDDIVSLLLEHGADINARDTLHDHCALTAACQNGQVSTVKLLIAKGYDVNRVRDLVSSPLIDAARSEFHSETVTELILNAGGNVKHLYYNRNHACIGDCLFCVASQATSKCLSLLIAAGANPDGWHFLGSPLTEAASNGRADNVSLLLEHGADPHKRVDPNSTWVDFAGKTALEIAKMNKKKAVVKILEAAMKKTTPKNQ